LTKLLAERVAFLVRIEPSFETPTSSAETPSIADTPRHMYSVSPMLMVVELKAALCEGPRRKSRDDGGAVGW